MISAKKKVLRVSYCCGIEVQTFLNLCLHKKSNITLASVISTMKIKQKKDFIFSQLGNDLFIHANDFSKCIGQNGDVGASTAAETHVAFHTRRSFHFKSDLTDISTHFKNDIPGYETNPFVKSPDLASS